MTDFFYSMPIWLAAILVLSISLATGLGSSVGVQKLVRVKATDEDKEVAINFMQVVAAYVGILIAFAGVEVWQEFTDARGSVTHEAANASQLYQDLGMYGPETRDAREALRAYVVSITNDEWPALKEGRGSQTTEVALQRVFLEVSKLNPEDNRSTEIFSEIFGKLNDLVQFRHERIVDSQTGIPVLLWSIGLFGALLTVAYASAFTATRFSIFMIGGISLTLGLVFLFILTVDHPFKGNLSVSPRPLVEVLDEFGRLDHLHR